MKYVPIEFKLGIAMYYSEPSYGSQRSFHDLDAITQEAWIARGNRFRRRAMEYGLTVNEVQEKKRVRKPSRKNDS